MKSKLIFLFSSFALLFLLSGCVSPYGGTFRFRGPGGIDQFSKEFHQCVVQSRGSGSGSLVTVNNGRQASDMPVCGELRLCLASKGYYQDPNGNIDAAPVAVRCSP